MIIKTIFNNKMINNNKRNNNKINSKIIKKSILVLLCLCYALSSNTYASTFIDVNEDDWFYEEVSRAYDNHLVKGNDTNEFMPNSYISCAELITMLNNISKEYSIKYKNDFQNIYTLHDDPWYADVIKWGLSRNIIELNNNYNYGAENKLSRFDVIKMLYNHAKFEKIAKDSNSYIRFSNDNKNENEITTDTSNMSMHDKKLIEKFIDKDEITNEELPFIIWAVNNDIARGSYLEDNILSLNLSSNITRCEIIVMINRYCNYLKNPNEAKDRIDKLIEEEIKKEQKEEENKLKNSKPFECKHYSDGTMAILLYGNPTTGFTWVCDDYDNSVIEVSDTIYTPSATNLNLVGSGGVFTYNVKGLKEGSTKLTFSYLRTFVGPDSCANKVELNINVDKDNFICINDCDNCDYDCDNDCINCTSDCNN